MVNNDLSRLRVIPMQTYAIDHLAVNSGKYCKGGGGNTLPLKRGEVHGSLPVRFECLAGA